MRTGSYLEPEGKEGLAAFTGSQIRRGGTKSLTAEQLDEKLDFLAAQACDRHRRHRGLAPRLNCLSDNLDESLAVFVEMLRFPRFQEDRLALAKEQALQEMKKRNDDAADIERLRVERAALRREALHEPLTTEASVKSITRDDMVAFHRKYFQPADMIAGGRGLVQEGRHAAEAGDRVRRLAQHAHAGAAAAGRDLPAAPGLYRMQKDVNQGRVSIGLPAVKRDHPDVYALEVMNEILGGSGFTSRITRTVRSNEGLAYSAGSGLTPRRVVAGRASAPPSSRRAAPCPTPRSWCWRRSRRCATRP